MSRIIDGMIPGFVPGLYPAPPAEQIESPVPGIREANRERLKFIQENDRRGRETARQREKAQTEWEKTAAASQLAKRENVSPRLYSLILKLETEKAKK
jgi:hypothetical protein